MKSKFTVSMFSKTTACRRTLWVLIALATGVLPVLISPGANSVHGTSAAVGTHSDARLGDRTVPAAQSHSGSGAP